MSTPYIPPEIIIMIHDCLDLDDLLLNVRSVSGLWNLAAVARASEHLTDWPDVVPHLSPDEVQIFVPRKSFKETETQRKGYRVLFSRTRHRRWNTSPTIFFCCVLSKHLLPLDSEKTQFRV